MANADAALLALVQVDVVESTEEDILFSLSLYVKNGISQYIELVGNLIVVFRISLTPRCAC